MRPPNFCHFFVVALLTPARLRLCAAEVFRANVVKSGSASALDFLAYTEHARGTACGRCRPRRLMSRARDRLRSLALSAQIGGAVDVVMLAEYECARSRGSREGMCGCVVAESGVGGGIMGKVRQRGPAIEDQREASERCKRWTAADSPLRTLFL